MRWTDVTHQMPVRTRAHGSVSTHYVHNASQPADDGSFETDVPVQGDSSHTFETVGRFLYFRAIHPRVTGRIVVT